MVEPCVSLPVSSYRLEKNLSIIYKSIFLYRFLMLSLYRTEYAKRYSRVFRQIVKYNFRSVHELCFGDTHLAKFCSNQKLEYSGIDLSETFVRRATRLGFNCTAGDVLVAPWPIVDCVVMMASA